MREQLTRFEDVDTALLAIDPHEAWSAKYLLKETGFSTDALNYPMLTDPSLTVSASYGVAFQMRIHTELSNRPATFVIDKAGTIRFEQRASTFSDRPTPDQIIQILKKMK
ncbi:MAG: redoxin domain-containing protein [Fuerstiella sp.]|nr:redoxin domain-containing protein [Fuerstiella sp.]MCP4855249.1 redoxin domain-containing protein [Fuerstiella sp.]